MILESILILVACSIIIGAFNLYGSVKFKKKPLAMKVKLPGGLPIISLYNNNKVFNFIIDSGSNISHISSEYYSQLSAELMGTYKEGQIKGLGANNIGVTMCKATLKDLFNKEYDVNLSISKEFADVANHISASTNIPIHGLLGTDFLNKYNFIINFESLELYNK